MMVPSNKGNKSLCTPYVETPFPVNCGPSGTASLSISSKKMMPYSSTYFNAYFWISIVGKLLFNLSEYIVYRIFATYLTVLVIGLWGG